MDSLADLVGPVDFMLSDGLPPYALPVLQVVAATLRQGARCGEPQRGGAAGDHADYVAFLRDPANGFLSAGQVLAGEFSVRL